MFVSFGCKIGRLVVCTHRIIRTTGEELSLSSEGKPAEPDPERAMKVDLYVLV